MITKEPKKNTVCKRAAIAACVAGTFAAAVPAQAANWLMLQGTEPAAAAARARIWGFIQPEYQHTDGGLLKSGPWAGSRMQLNEILPDRETNSQFNIRRARIGVRGAALPLDPNVNYFFLAEFGNNGITKPGGGGGSAKLTDASLTLNHIKGARVRIGQFKYPGSEEGLQAIHTFDYINFTSVSDQALLERFVDFDGSGTSPAAQSDNGVNLPTGPVNAFRDVGIQVFDSFKMSGWEHSYAVMIGNGNGIEFGDNNEEKDWYYYWSSEKIFGGKGPRRQGLKLFAWYNDGTRTLTFEQGTATAADDVKKDVDRDRWGVGATFRRGKWRAGAEYIKADGLIRDGTDGGAALNEPRLANGVKAGINYADSEADGWYIDLGYKPHPKWELDVRYDRYNRDTARAPTDEERFEKWTLGAQYFFNRKTRGILNYEIRDADAPNGPAGKKALLDSQDNLVAAQLLVIF